MKKAIIILIMTFIPLAGICPQGTATQKEKAIYSLKKQIFIKSIYEKAFSIELFREALTYAGIQQPDIVFKQAILETGNFTSELFLYGNNLFGMKLAQTRQTTAIGKMDYHARYYHWFDSVVDLRLWQDWYAGKSYDLNDYYTFLQQIRYATDKYYINYSRTYFISFKFIR
jgi:hypothetical protein